MKSERLVVLIAPEEKARLIALAQARQSSVGELVREAVARLDAPRTARATPANAEVSEPDADEQAGWPEAPMLQLDQAAALERLADMALRTMHRANAALDQAFEEVEATKAYFAAKRRKCGAEA